MRRTSMRRASRRLIAAACLACLAGCTTLQPLPVEQGTPLGDLLQTGQHIVVYRRDGRIVDMRYVRMDADRLRGSLYADGLHAVAIPVADIERIEVERVEPVRTSGAVLGTIVLLPIAALGFGATLAEQ